MLQSRDGCSFSMEECMAPAMLYKVLVTKECCYDGEKLRGAPKMKMGFERVNFEGK